MSNLGRIQIDGPQDDVFQKMTMIGEAIKAAREARGLTQKELSKLTGVSTGLISEIENNVRAEINMVSLIILGNFFGIEVLKVLSGTQQKLYHVTRGPERRFRTYGPRDEAEVEVDTKTPILKLNQYEVLDENPSAPVQFKEVTLNNPDLDLFEIKVIFDETKYQLVHVLDGMVEVHFFGDPDYEKYGEPLLLAKGDSMSLHDKVPHGIRAHKHPATILLLKVA